MALDPATGTLLGAIVGATTGVVGTVATSWLALRKEREARLDERLEEAEKWERDQLAFALTASMKQVSLYTAMALSKSVEQLQNDAATRESNAELQRVLVALVMAYPDKSSQEYLGLVQAIDQALWKGAPTATDVWPLRQLIVKLAARVGIKAFQSANKN